MSGEHLIHQLLNELGENPKRGGLVETPERVMKAWRFWCSGYGADPAEVLKSFEDGAESYDEMVFQGSIQFFSSCEHHMAPFFGSAHVAYIPNGRVVGLSKIARLIEVYSRRLQVQERLTGQVVDALMEHLKPLGAAVVLQARHLCMESRGVQKMGTVTTTVALRGVFKERPEVRNEFMSLVRSEPRRI